MVDSPSLFLAFAAGFVSFVSPCCLPLVPGYLAAISGTKGVPTRQRALLLRSLAFVATFSLIFILLGLTATAIGSFLATSALTLRKVSGAAIALMGLLFIGSVFVLRLNRDFRPRKLSERAGGSGPIVAGAAFALAWTPCVGPTLGAILGLASSQSSTVRAAGLLTVYSAGLAVPFLLSAVGFNAAQRSFRFLKRHYPAVQIAAGGLLVVMGVLVYTNQLYRINIAILHALDDLGLNIFRSV
jgi:cytochrome c-type biogenesis protein